MSSILILPIFTRVEAISPLSENTVTVIQLLSSNLFSAACIPVFKAMRYASGTAPRFTYSFHFLVFLCPTIHLTAIYIASFQAKHSPREEEEQKNEFTRTRSEQMKKSPIPRRPQQRLRDQPWRKKYPFLVPRTWSRSLPGTSSLRSMFTLKEIIEIVHKWFL